MHSERHRLRLTHHNKCQAGRQTDPVEHVSRSYGESPADWPYRRNGRSRKCRPQKHRPQALHDPLTGSTDLLPDPAGLFSSSVPPFKLLLTPLPRSKSTSALDDISHLCSLVCIPEYITPPSIQAASVERPLAKVDLAIGVLSCKVQYQWCGVWLERLDLG